MSLCPDAALGLAAAYAVGDPCAWRDMGVRQWGCWHVRHSRWGDAGYQQGQNRAGFKIGVCEAVREGRRAG
jgi:hypothetical protein